MKPHLLIIEDEMAIRTMLRCAFEIAGYSVAEAENVDAAKNNLLKHLPDLIVLDWMLPKTSGIHFAKQLKKNATTRHIPIIFLSARAAEEDKVHGLSAGADDYVIKPFSPRELIARVQAILRRSRIKENSAETAELIAQHLKIDLNSERVYLNDQLIKLAPTEFRLLKFLMQSPDRVHSRSTLLSHVWTKCADVDERTVDVHVRRLRKQLCADQKNQFIETVRGSGYRFTLVHQSYEK